jgi:hypothetical protein
VQKKIWICRKTSKLHHLLKCKVFFLMYLKFHFYMKKGSISGRVKLPKDYKLDISWFFAKHATWNKMKNCLARSKDNVNRESSHKVYKWIVSFQWALCTKQTLSSSSRSKLRYLNQKWKKPNGFPSCQSLLPIARRH